jgi:hypothetical protein
MYCVMKMKKNYNKPDRISRMWQNHKIQTDSPSHLNINAYKECTRKHQKKSENDTICYILTMSWQWLAVRHGFVIFYSRGEE